MTKKTNNEYISKEIKRLLNKRSHKLMDCLHKISNFIVMYAKNNNIGNIVIGYNKGWKNKTSMGKTNNRRFYEVPFRRLVSMIFYKGFDNGINVNEIKESYTSKTDSLALEEIKHHDKYKGTRTYRGLFISSTGNKLNADVNGSLNIMRKYSYKYKLKVDFKNLFKKHLKKYLSPIKINMKSLSHYKEL